MFKFLKKKLKKFEDQLEAELEAELEKEIKPELEEPKPEPIPTPPKPVVEEKPVEKPKEIPKPVEKPPEKEIPKPVTIKPKEVKKPIEPVKKEIPEEKPEEIDKKIDQLIKKVEKPDEKERKARIERDRRKRQEEIDKQIEKSIETELEHTLRAKRSIQEIVKVEKKPTRGISEEKLDDLLWELEVGLLESDVAYTVIESIKKDLKEELRNISFEKGKVGETVEKVLKNAISHVLKSNELDFNEFIEKNEKPVVIMFVGVNGSGKTLAIAKIATMLKKMGKSCVMAAGDTFRAGAIEQLTIHAEKVGVKIIKHGPGADPAAVAFDAIDHAKAKHKDVVLLDTAGRVQTNINLMDEMAKIKRVAKPSMIIFVGDALSGNDAVEQAKRFNEVVGIDGVILTKVDTDAKGGSALSVAYTIGKPLLYIGVGQGYEDHVAFDPEWMIENIFGKSEG
ncbi:MAG: signal recognition particle-docking protein FtsY [Thermoplasmatales archaeon]|nr:signal recognition particle-docking protein FtsY [Thermoplasmatales archaeon]